MENIETRLTDKDWQPITQELHNKRFLVVKNVLTKNECDILIAQYDADEEKERAVSNH